jgi:AcrR family transcriptional regulator
MVPKLWTETVETHRREVRDAIVDAAGILVQRQGLLGVSMSMVANAAGIGRATLYKYFPDVESVLAAWHLRHVEEHLRQLTELWDHAGEPAEALRALLTAYARICQRRHRHGADELSAVLHRDPQIVELQHRLHALVGDAITAAVGSGAVRHDVPAEELARYSLHALAAAATASSEAALNRLVDLVWAGLAAPSK